MFKRLLPTALIGYLFVVLVNWGCTKLDTTSLGSDLIPAVDNVNTFADTLDIITTQGIFDDSFKISKSENNLLGKISDDPVFGSTEAQMYFQLKPSFYPYYFGNAGDTLVGLDSVVLCLNYVGFWGDSSVEQRLEVLPFIDQQFADSAYYPKDIRFQPAAYGPSIGATDVLISKLKDSIKLRGDSVNNQIRIKLDPVFAQELFGRDSTKAGIGGNNAFYSDSIFRRKYNGFAVRNTTGSGGKALMYISLTNAKTRLEIHYRKKKTGTGVLDTTFSSFVINSNDFGTNYPSVTSNYIHRNYNANVQTAAGNSLSPRLFLATGPGTYANMRIPQLDTIGNANGTHNRIVHRAEIYMEQDPFENTIDSIFSAPPYMYVDLKDTGTTLKWKPIYHDLSPNEPYDPDFLRAGFPYYPGSGGVDFNYFGGYARVRYNYLGEKVVYYTINTTRHVQRLLTGQNINYEMRLYPAYNIYYPQYLNASPIAYSNPLALGRIRLKSGAYPDKQLKMRMVIIWSKLP